MASLNMMYIALGVVGGLLPDVIRLIKNRYKLSIPEYLKTVNFWLGLLLMAIIGGLAAWAFSPTSGKEAIIYGYAAPQLFSSLAAEEVKNARIKGVQISIRSWWAL